MLNLTPANFGNAYLGILPETVYNVQLVFFNVPPRRKIHE